MTDVAVSSPAAWPNQTTASQLGPAPKRIVVAYGFWIFLLSDVVMFSALFAAYAVLAHATASKLPAFWPRATPAG
jgi:cytochrome o ubiquinol oxidase subunit III